MAITLGAALALGGLTSLVSGISDANVASKNLQAVRETNEMNYKIAQETNAQNMLLNERQMDNARYLQADSQAYNSAQREVARLREAGLNPALVYGDSPSVGSVSVPSAIPAVAGSPMQPPVYSDVVGKAVQTGLDNTLNLVGTSEQIDSMHYDNMIKAATMSTKITEAKVDLENKKKSGNLTEKQIESINKQIQELDDTLKFLKDTYQGRVDAVDLKNNALREEIALHQSQTALNEANRQLIDVRKDLEVKANSREEQALKASLAEIFQRIQNMKKDNELTDANIKATVQNVMNLKFDGIRSLQEIVHNKNLYPVLYKAALLDAQKTAFNYITNPLGALDAFSGFSSGGSMTNLIKPFMRK